MLKVSRYFFLCLLLLVMQQLAAQTPGIRAKLETLISQKQFETADTLVQAELSHYFTKGPLDSIPALVQYLGRITSKRFNPDIAIQKVNLLVSRLKTRNAGASVLSEAYAEAGEFYGSLGLNEQAYRANEEAYQLALQIPGKPQLNLAIIDSDMGTFAFRMGDIAVSARHHRRALEIFQDMPNPDYDRLYTGWNNMGGIMWMASKTDSALYFFNKALDALGRMEKTPINQYYRPAVLMNNLAALYNIEGNTTRAIEAMKSTIQNLRTYLSIKETVPKKANTIGFQYEATDNLAGIYKEIGDYSQAHQLLMYSYQQKQKNEDGDKMGVYYSQVLLGQLYYAMRDYSKALDFLMLGLSNIKKADGDNLTWQADASSTLALLHDEQNQKVLASHYYELADSLYEVSLQGSYDDIYLDFLRNAALYYAENNQLQLAISKADKGYRYVTKNQGTETLLAFYQLLNVAEVYLLAGRYQQSLEASTKGISIVEKIAAQSANKLDSVKTELKKPKAVLLNARARYALMDKKDISNLTLLLNDLNAALDLLDKRKSLLNDSKDISLMMADHSDLLGFIKKINLDLHQLTNDQGYMEKLIDLHESGIYSRIRSRLDKSDSIRFAHIPPDVLQRERELKQAIKLSLEQEESHHKSMGRYFKAVDEWSRFQEMVKTRYPQYYRLRYETIFRSLKDVQTSLPEQTTLVRYFFVEKELYALVADRQGKKMFPLRAEGVEEYINAVTQYTSQVNKTTDALHQLYLSLWAPFEKEVKHKKIIIVPDGILFTLNFEILTPARIHRFESLATQSLLAKHTISYHYSLSLVGQKQKTSNGDLNNFVAFAPGFLDDEKKRYQQNIEDSFNIDRGYVSLLPQPFTLAFVSKAKNMLGGKAFTNEASTANSFRNNAGRNRIIHIGTHAESNNLVPEFSRLIFSKSGKAEEQNSIYLHELYNCDLTSDLAVLTACESGRPGYQDGEGMISLAHAFNYAGSESILTGLWKIDEKASTILMEHFYQYLVDGMEKDEALRLAKLDYLKTSKGRMLAPQYWAGLVLMGDTSPVELEKPASKRNWAIVGLVAILIIPAIYIYRKRKTQDA